MIKEDLFSIQFIDIVSVENSSPISDFSTNEIERLANNYLECGGNINPIIVERTGLDEYKVIKGNLELYAAKKAKEKDKFFEMIRAIILNKKNEKAVNEQVNFLEKTNTSYPVNLPVNLEADPSLLRLENNLLAKIDSLNQKSNSLSNLNIIQRLEELESSLVAKFNDLNKRFDILEKTSINTDLRSNIVEKTDFNRLNLAKLKEEAKKRGFSGYSKLRKAELVALLSAPRHSSSL